METDFEIAYKQVLGEPGSHKVLPLSVNASGEYLRKDLVKHLWTILSEENKKLVDELNETKLSLQVANQGLDILYGENEDIKQQLKECGNQL